MSQCLLLEGRLASGAITGKREIMSKSRALGKGAESGARSIQVENGQVYQIKSVDAGSDSGAGVTAVRQGDDLVITYSDGTQVVLSGFFSATDVKAVFTNTSEGDVVINEGAVGQALSDGRALVHAAGDADVLLNMAQGDAGLLDIWGQGAYQVFGDGNGFGTSFLPLLAGGLSCSVVPTTQMCLRCLLFWLPPAPRSAAWRSPGRRLVSTWMVTGHRIAPPSWMVEATGR